MKKNILVILVVIGVIGVVAYLLKDRLKVLLGERPTGIPSPEIKEPMEDSAYRYRFGPLTGVSPIIMEKIGQRKEYFGQPVARWLQEEIAPLLKPLYPQRYIAITKGLLAYLTIGEAALPPDQEVVTQISPYHEPTGPYSWALPQF